MWLTLPGFGTLVVYGILLMAAYTFAIALAAGQGRPRLLDSARLGAYATSGLIFCGVLLLAYAFITHDFRIRYVSRYSDRSMSTTYLLTSLWGGQDGSLLWWTFLLGGYTAGAVRWMKGRYRELQPYVIATLMVVVAFFAILMIFAANPFEQNLAGAKSEGDGLNPLLQNYWMVIHPPCLYMGFVGCAVPFAFAVAALVTGRLDSEWIVAVRKWMLFAFLFLSIGNVLGMVWAYEVLGWGGFWAWDPVENAACLPWFTAAAYVHSTMIQERRNMLKVWNVVLICLTFLLTIFGTFLTRSGLIASVHSFAKSDIGPYFAIFLFFVFFASAGLIVWRIPQLLSKVSLESMASREAMFVVNNWALLGGMTFILGATTSPLLSEWILNQKVTVGPPFYNKWMAPIGLVIFALMGLAPLFGWKKTSGESLRKAFSFPLGVFVGAAVLHLALGSHIGAPAIVEPTKLESGLLAGLFSRVSSVFPLITVSLAAFNLAVIAQEFQRGIAARRASSGKKGEQESVLVALLRLVDKSRRRYGGYIVHVGICCMFLGFVGSAWALEAEAVLKPGESHVIGDYKLTYKGTRMCPGNPACSPAEQAEMGKRMLFADLDVSKNGKALGTVHPAKFIYTSPPQTTSEVGMIRGLRSDLYTVLAVADPQTKKATIKLHVNPFVSWIWIGLLVLIFGCTLSLWPEVSARRASAWSYVRFAAGATAGIGFALYLSTSLSTPYSAPLRGSLASVAAAAPAARTLPAHPALPANPVPFDAR